MTGCAQNLKAFSLSAFSFLSSVENINQCTVQTSINLLEYRIGVSI